MSYPHRGEERPRIVAIPPFARNIVGYIHAIAIYMHFMGLLDEEELYEKLASQIEDEVNAMAFYNNESYREFLKTFYELLKRRFRDLLPPEPDPSEVFSRRRYIEWIMENRHKIFRGGYTTREIEDEATSIINKLTVIAFRVVAKQMGILP